MVYINHSSCSRTADFSMDFEDISLIRQSKLCQSSIALVVKARAKMFSCFLFVANDIKNQRNVKTISNYFD